MGAFEDTSKLQHDECVVFFKCQEGETNSSLLLVHFLRRQILLLLN